MTGNLKSPLAREADYVLDIEVEKEACPMGLAPTASTTAALVMGDALVVALIKLKGFREENFAVYHPGGALGRRLLTNVESIMHKELPVVYTETNLKDIIYEISSKRVGMTMVYNYENEVVGLITDGDIRRHIFEGYDDIKNIQARDIMIKDFKFIGAEEMASKAWGIMNEANISSLPVIENGQLKGIITMHDVFDFKN